MKRLLLAAIMAAVLLAATPLVRRELIAVAELDFKDQLQGHEIDVFGLPRGIYIDGVGVVFNSDVSLVYTPMVTPFQQTFSPEYRAKIHSKKLLQVPVLIEQMKAAVMKASGSLDALPMKERVVVGVTVNYHAWENKTDLPSQIVVQGEKGKLLEAKLAGQPAGSVMQVQIQQ